MSVRLVSAPLSISFSLQSDNEELFQREYDQLSENHNDPIGQWLKLAKARGETSESDPVLLNLLVELHRKVDALEKLIKEEEPDFVDLEYDEEIESIGYGYFKLKNGVLKEEESYYGRVSMPVHPKREIGVFFRAKSSVLAKIERIHSRDEKEWGSYLTSRERIIIREMREKSL